MDEKSIWGTENRVIAKRLIPEREGGRWTYQTRSLTPIEEQVQMSNGNTLQESCCWFKVEYPTTNDDLSCLR